MSFPENHQKIAHELQVLFHREHDAAEFALGCTVASRGGT